MWQNAYAWGTLACWAGPPTAPLWTLQPTQVCGNREQPTRKIFLAFGERVGRVQAFHEMPGMLGTCTLEQLLGNPEKPPPEQPAHRGVLQMLERLELDLILRATKKRAAEADAAQQRATKKCAAQKHNQKQTVPCRASHALLWLGEVRRASVCVWGGGGEVLYAGPLRHLLTPTAIRTGRSFSNFSPVAPIF